MGCRGCGGAESGQDRHLSRFDGRMKQIVVFMLKQIGIVEDAEDQAGFTGWELTIVQSGVLGFGLGAELG